MTGGLVRQPRLLVIQHNLDDSLNDLGGALVAAGLRIDTWCTFRTEAPPFPLQLFDGVLSLGGTDSVADEAQLGWIVHERRLIEDALAAGIPILGVCFGAQMLARSAGGEVLPAPSSEIGWHEVQMSPAAAIDPVAAIPSSSAALPGPIIAPSNRMRSFNAVMAPSPRSRAAIFPEPPIACKSPGPARGQRQGQLR